MRHRHCHRHCLYDISLPSSSSSSLRQQNNRGKECAYRTRKGVECGAPHSSAESRSPSRAATAAASLAACSCAPSQLPAYHSHRHRRDKDTDAKTNINTNINTVSPSAISHTAAMYHNTYDDAQQNIHTAETRQDQTRPDSPWHKTPDTWLRKS